MACRVAKIQMPIQKEIWQSLSKSQAHLPFDPAIPSRNLPHRTYRNKVAHEQVYTTREKKQPKNLQWGVHSCHGTLYSQKDEEAPSALIWKASKIEYQVKNARLQSSVKSMFLLRKKRTYTLICSLLHKETLQSHLRNQ